ncbi:gamma-glutamyltransferase [Hypericibacter sp.]|uniref:gamma-glutamyltransferase n=1 Tax=Hypericibacter sp. TaxID=2705401 RepID=UPI003D6D37BF
MRQRVLIRAGSALIGVTTLLLLASCEPPKPPGMIGSVSGFAGAAVADEPRAAVVARDVLSAGGSAADAAVALYFALAVTMPSTAALGGGGVCIVHDADKKTTEVLDFLPRAAPDGRIAVPLSVRGMAALQARYGKLRWEQLLGPAEQMARLGTPTSRALARELVSAGARLAQDDEMARIFLHPDGTPLQEGEPLRQELLGGVLTQLRIKGAGEFYSGTLAHTIADAAQRLGAPLTVEALRNAKPEFKPALEVPFGDHTIYLSQPPAAGGVVFGQMVEMMIDVQNFADTPDGERPHLVAEAAERAFVDRSGWMLPDGSSKVDPATLITEDYVNTLMKGYDKARAAPANPFVTVPENPWASGFVTADADGNAVACNVTMNNLFGAGRMAPGTGILLAPAPNDRGAGYRALGPVLMANKATGEFFFAGAASGGETAASSLAQVFVRVADAKQSLADAEAAPRFHHNGSPDIVYTESLDRSQSDNSLTQRGHQIQEIDSIGRVNAIWCPKSLQRDSSSCSADADPRAFGLAVVQTGK